MSEKKTTPCMEGLVALTETELDTVSGGEATVTASLTVAASPGGTAQVSFASSASGASADVRISVTSDGVTVVRNVTGPGSASVLFALG